MCLSLFLSVKAEPSAEFPLISQGKIVYNLSAKTNLAVVPVDWGDYQQFGDVCYADPKVYPQITHVDYSVLHDGHPSMRIEHHVEGVDPNRAREIDVSWFAVKPGDHIVFKCWIKTGPQASGYANDLGLRWGSGGRIGIDFYGENYIGGVSYNPKGASPTTNSPSSTEQRANYVLWGSDWEFRTIDLIVPPYFASDGYVFPEGEMKLVKGIIPWAQAWSNEPGTGIAWFADAELYINPD